MALAKQLSIEDHASCAIWHGPRCCQCNTCPTRLIIHPLIVATPFKDACKHPPSEWRNCYTQGRSIPQPQRPWDWSESRFSTRKTIVHKQCAGHENTQAGHKANWESLCFSSELNKFRSASKPKMVEGNKNKWRRQGNTSTWVTRFPSSAQVTPLLQISSVSLETGPYLIKLQPTYMCVEVVQQCETQHVCGYCRAGWVTVNKWTAWEGEENYTGPINKWER